ncbi:cobalt-precorrin-6A reductase [Streptomyces sp. NRRL S-31]|uniref:cobalt-precorrin-6A reductase n=1 Tax=Streptomyces sp. NRRL S-31 TaxID=1463898 RepID=UPI0004C6E402|nr:cobalt-precorrin-6A reductase [Streptomyces sp. NRRL S-31]
MRVLILGGTTEARRLAELLHGTPGLELTSSLAGRVADPRLPPGGTRIGGFGGAAGLAAWLREHGTGAVVDATHPFAGTIGHHALRAAAAVRVPLLVLRRPGWLPVEGDRWHEVGSLEEAAAALPALGRRVFLTTGRMGLAAFAALDDLWFLVRSVDAPGPPHPARMEVLLDRGPFTLDGERELLRRHRVDVVVTKDSGGAATAPKLAAAREAGLPVVLVRRPPAPEGVPVVPDAGSAARWVRERLARGPSPDR